MAQILNIETGEVFSIFKGYQGQKVWEVCVEDINVFSRRKVNN